VDGGLNYTFMTKQNVELKSPDSDCNVYSDFVITKHGSPEGLVLCSLLIYVK
jgi:hypothetical protein